MTWWKRMLVGAAASLGLLCLGTLNSPAYASGSGPTVYVDGQQLDFDVQPFIYQDRTLVPMRMIFEAMGANVTWDNATQSAIATENGITVRMPIGKRNVTVNGKTIVIDVPAMISNGRTMVPVHFISDAFGNQLTWNQQSLTVRITTVNAPQVRIIEADRYTSDTQAANVASMIQAQNVVQQDQQEVGFKYQQPIWLYLVNSDDGYKQAIVNYGGGGDQVDLIAKNSDGLTEDSNIMLPLQKQSSSQDELMTIAHEMMHVLLNQNGGSTLPSWVHEGLAWETGLDVSLGNEPAIMRQSYDGMIRDDVLHGVASNQYQPLIDGMTDEIDGIAAASYNLEFQDYLAYRYLVNKYGKDTFNQYVQRYSQDESDAFATTFNMSEQTFENQFHQYLIQESQKTDSGVQLTLQIPANFNGSFSILPQGTSVWRRVTLAPGTDTISIYKNGTITGASILDQSDDGGQPDNDTVYLFSSLDKPVQEQGVTADSGGLAVYDSYGQYVFSNVWLHTTSDKTTYPTGNSFFGIQLLNVQAIQ